MERDICWKPDRRKHLVTLEGLSEAEIAGRHMRDIEMSGNKSGQRMSRNKPELIKTSSL